MRQNKIKTNNIYKSVKNIVLRCGNLKSKEKVLIIYDKTTKNLLKYFIKIIKLKTTRIDISQIPEAKNDGVEPPLKIKKKMRISDLIICLTKKSLAHTNARKVANKLGAKYLSLADYSLTVLKNKATQVNFKNYFRDAEKLTKILNKGKIIKVSTKIGTNLKFYIKNRKANFAPGICNKKGSLASPPDSEVNIAVIEDKSYGVAVIDGSVTTQEIGKLKSPIILKIEKGFVTNIKGKKGNVLKKIFSNNNKKARIIGEFGIGLNHKAKIIGNMLVDEGSRGNIHLGIGSNSTIGGKNKVNFHLDHVIKKPSVFIDDCKIIDKGKIL